MRRVYIIQRNVNPQDVVDTANQLNCPEIVRGIPPILKDVVAENDLPCVYEEPENLSIPPLSTHHGRVLEINPNEVKPVKIVRGWDGRQFTYNCFVSEGIKDQYLQGDIVVGDYVLVHYVDNDEGKPIVFAKAYKSW